MGRPAAIWEIKESATREAFEETAAWTEGCAWTEPASKLSLRSRANCVVISESTVRLSTSRNRELRACRPLKGEKKKKKKKCEEEGIWWWRCEYFLIEIFLSFVGAFQRGGANHFVREFGSNMRDLFIWITLFFKFCRSFNMFHFSAENTRWNKETEAESRLSSFKNYLHTIVDAPFLPLVNSSSSFGGVERTNPANKWEVWNSRQKNTSPRKRKSRGMDKE